MITCPKTYPEEYCEDTMKEIVREFYNPDVDIVLREDNIPTGYISDREYDLLIEYAAKLFDTLPTDRNLHDTMYGFVKKVDGYCNNLLFREHYDKNMEIKYLHLGKSLEYKADKIRKSIDNITGLVPGLTDEFRVMLKYLRRNAKRAVYHRGNLPLTLSPRTTPVKEYLYSLELPCKSDDIKSFTKKLKARTAE